MRQLRPTELAEWIAGAGPDRPAPLVLDVREPWEVETASLPGALNVPMGELAARAGELDPDRAIVCLCHHGMRSMHVALWLERQGFADVSNLAGGIDAWSRQVDASVPLY